MRPVSFIALIILLLTSACVRLASTSQPFNDQNPFTPAAATQLCSAADLQTSASAHEAGGVVTLGVTLINQFTSPCSLQPPPQISLLDADQTLDVEHLQAEPESGVPQDSLLMISPGESIVVALTWRNYCGEALQNGPDILLTLTGGETLTIKPNLRVSPSCEDASAPSTLTINPYSYPP
jgi:hypothetical protein